MVRKIIHVKDEGAEDILKTPALKVTYEEGIRIIKDLVDTANHNNETEEKKCCGLAANQIGENKSVFIIQLHDGGWLGIMNPVCKGKSRSSHISEEGCMSTDIITKVKRADSITLLFQSTKGKRFIENTFIGFAADEVQHELDHLRGILI